MLAFDCRLRDDGKDCARPKDGVGGEDGCSSEAGTLDVDSLRGDCGGRSEIVTGVSRDDACTYTVYVYVCVLCAWLFCVPVYGQYCAGAFRFH